jgi:hypothetical protein
MGKDPNTLVFISHASGDSRLALLIRDLFQKSLKLNPEKEVIFCSSDVRSIRMDEEPYERITQALQSAKAVIALMTPNSIYRPWVLFETGGAHFSRLDGVKNDSKSLFLVCANGITPRSLPAPLKRRQAGDLGQVDIIRELCKEVAEKLQKTEFLQIDEDLVSKISTEATKKVGDWELVQPALVGKKILDSPFGFENLLSAMKKTVFIAGQNLFHLTRDENKERYKKLLFEKLSEKGKRIQIMVCDPDCEYAVETWQAVTAERYAADLEHSVKVFNEWVEAAKRRKVKGTLDVRKTIIVPLTITFIDPEDKSGRLVFNPVVFDPISDLRPCYLLTKNDHRDIFDYYWTAYRDVFGDKSKTKVIGTV